jgi:hypothetical protein
MRRRRAQLALAAVSGCWLILAPPASAGPGTLSGRLADGKLPSAATGRAYVRAIRAQDGEVLAGASATRSGAWTLKLDPGYYVLAASVVRTDKAGVSAIAPVERVRSGRTTRTTVSLKRTKTPRPKRLRRGARAASTHSAAVGVRAFSGTGPNAQLGRGLAEMLIGDLTAASSGDCEPTVVEVIHRADILREIALANSQAADPRARIPAGNLIDPAFYIQGTVTTTATSAAWTIEVVDAATGTAIGGDSGSADGAAIFDASAGIAQRLSDLLCGSDYRVTVQVNGLITVPPYAGSGIAFADVPVRAVAGTAGPPTSWMGQTDVVFSGLQYGGVPDCVVSPGSHTGYVKVEIKKSTAPDLIEVTWGGETFTFTNLVCPGASIPNGVPPIMPFQQTLPTTFILPAAGGTQQVSGALGSAGGGWTNTGTVMVTRVPKGT